MFPRLGHTSLLQSDAWIGGRAEPRPDLALASRELQRAAARPRRRGGRCCRRGGKARTNKTAQWQHLVDEAGPAAAPETFLHFGGNGFSPAHPRQFPAQLSPQGAAFRVGHLARTFQAELPGRLGSETDQVPQDRT